MDGREVLLTKLEKYSKQDVRLNQLKKLYVSTTHTYKEKYEKLIKLELSHKRMMQEKISEKIKNLSLILYQYEEKIKNTTTMNFTPEQIKQMAKENDTVVRDFEKKFSEISTLAEEISAVDETLIDTSAEESIREELGLGDILHPSYESKEEEEKELAYNNNEMNLNEKENDKIIYTAYRYYDHVNDLLDNFNYYDEIDETQFTPEVDAEFEAFMNGTSQTEAATVADQSTMAADDPTQYFALLGLVDLIIPSSESKHEEKKELAFEDY